MTELRRRKVLSGLACLLDPDFVSEWETEPYPGAWDGWFRLVEWDRAVSDWTWVDKDGAPLTVVDGG